MSRRPIPQSTSTIHPHQPHALAASAAGATVVVEQEEPARLSEYKDMLLDHKWLIAGTIAAALIAGLVYALLATPVYRASLLVQIDDFTPESKSTLNEASGLLDAKTPATGEMQVLASRMVLNAAADKANIQIHAQPRYLPLVGHWLARRARELSEPGFLGLGGFVTGRERIRVARFAVPESLEDTDPFIVTAQGNGRYTVRHELIDAPLEGTVGQKLRHVLPEGVIEIDITELAGLAGADYTVAVASRFRAIERLQQRLKLGEQGRQSNVIGVSLEDSDRERLGRVLNAIGDEYVRQNMERRSAEAERTLAFLSAQLPQFQRQLQASEDAYAAFRKKNGTVDFDEEASVWLKKTAELQTALLELEQKRRESDLIFTDQSPRMRLLNQQIGAVQGQLDALNARVAGMPHVQRDALRLEREVRVNGTLYQSMQNNALQMRLVKEGRIGNVRLIDKAEVSKLPVKPKKALVLAFALVIGALLGPGLAILHARTKSGVRNAHEIEDLTGLEVYAVVPQSEEQLVLEQHDAKAFSGSLLAEASPHSAAVEALRTLRVGLKPALAEASNNLVFITGATPGIGKSFIARNFAALLAQSGKRVLLVNADFRKGEPYGAFGLPQEGGLSELLAGTLGEDQAIHVQVRPNLDVLTTGQLPELATDMLESDAFVLALERFSVHYDLVVIDAAPVLVAADAAAVAPACGVVLLVARAEQSQLGELNESVRRLTQAGAHISGVLLNGMDLRRHYNGSHGYRLGSYRYASVASASRTAQG